MELWWACTAPWPHIENEGLRQAYNGGRVAAILCVLYIIYAAIMFALMQWWPAPLKRLDRLVCEKVLGHDYAAWCQDPAWRDRCRRCGIQKSKRR